MKTINCPTCGAKTNSVAAHCEYCEIEIEVCQSISPEEYVAGLRKCFETASNKKYNELFGKDDAQLDVVAGFPVPSNLQLLMAFFSFCASNDQEIEDPTTTDGKLVRAWRGKAAAAYQQLQFASMNDPRLTEVLRMQADRYSPNALERRAKQENLKVLMWVILILVLLGGAALFLVVMHFIDKK